MADTLCNIWQNLYTGVLFPIMNGWIDGVLKLGFSFLLKKQTQGIFKDKTGMLFTTGSHGSLFIVNGSFKQAVTKNLFIHLCK